MAPASGNSPDTAAIRQDAAAELTRALEGALGGSGYRLGAIAFGRAVELRIEQGGAAFTVWLRRLDEPGGAYRETARFKLGYDPEPPDKSGFRVIDAICERIAVWERSLSDAAAAQLIDPRPEEAEEAASSAAAWDVELDLEWLAVQHGLKPAFRKVVAAADVDALLARAQRDGMAPVVTPAGAFIKAFCGRDESAVDPATLSTLLHVGRSPAEATAAADAERSMIESCRAEAGVSEAQVRALGAALGYPLCCVEAFLPVRDSSNAEIRFRALQRSGRRLPWQLNELGGLYLVSHLLCRYDCAPSLRQAAAVADALARHAPPLAEQLRRQLSGVMVVSRSGAAVRLIDAAELPSGSYRFAAAEAIGSAGDLADWTAAAGGADELQLAGETARFLRRGRETARLVAAPDRVRIHVFA